MNRLIKAIVAFLGGINTAFGIASPILVTLLITVVIPNLGDLNRWLLLIIGILSAIYRGLKVWID